MIKTVLLTGGSRGIGLACKNQLKSEGYQIITPTRGELDLSDINSVKNYAKKNNKLNLYALINNAGINKPEWIEDISDNNIYETIQVNLISPIILVREFLPLLNGKNLSHIINITSMFGIIARGKQTAYVMSKFALNGATKSLALELAKYNILVNSVCPGFVDTDMTKNNAKKKNSELANEIPLGRFARTSEIANLVSFLISEKNTYITGSNILIDGGYSVK